MDTEVKVIDDRVPDEELYRVDDTQQAMEKELRIYQGTNSVYEIP